MAAHERRCFAEAAGVPIENIQMHFMQDGRPTRGEFMTGEAVFFGGSGAYSVLDDHPWIRDMLASLREAVELGRPAYASCFGFQGLSRAMGGEVISDDSRTEMGGTPLELTNEGVQDGLFGALPPEFFGQQGHQDHVVGLPKGVTLLARGFDIEAQAFRVDGVPFWASQFHPELRRRHTIERFEHYVEHYLAEDTNVEAVYAELKGKPETPEVGDLLARLIRGDF